MQFRMWQEGEVFYAKLSHPSNNLPLPQVVGSNRATPRHSILNARAQHQYADLPAMEEKSTFVAKDEAESDKASQGKRRKDLKTNSKPTDIDKFLCACRRFTSSTSRATT